MSAPAVEFVVVVILVVARGDAINGLVPATATMYYGRWLGSTGTGSNAGGFR